MAARTFSATATSDAPPDVVWDVLVDGPGWPRWTFVPKASYERTGDPAPHGVGAIRRFGTPPFVSREEVTTFDAPARFAYRALSGLPVKAYSSEVVLAPTANGGTTITWTSTVEEKLPGTGGALAFVLRKMIGSFTRNLASYSNTAFDRGRPPGPE